MHYQLPLYVINLRCVVSDEFFVVPRQLLRRHGAQLVATVAVAVAAVVDVVVMSCTQRVVGEGVSYNSLQAVLAWMRGASRM